MKKTIGNVSYTDENKIDKYLSTCSDEEQQQNEINRENAKAVFSPEFIPYYVGVQKQFELSCEETLIYGFLRFYLVSSKNSKFYFTNKQLEDILNISGSVISAGLKKLKNIGMILPKYKIKSGGGKIRFINSNESDLLSMVDMNFNRISRKPRAGCRKLEKNCVKLDEVREPYSGFQKKNDTSTPSAWKSESPELVNNKNKINDNNTNYNKNEFSPPRGGQNEKENFSSCQTPSQSEPSSASNEPSTSTDSPPPLSSASVAQPTLTPPPPLVVSNGLYQEFPPATHQEIVAIFDILLEINEGIRKMYGWPAQRDAVNLLVRRYGFNEVKKMAEFAIRIQGMQYAPKITTPDQLLKKSADLRDFVARTILNKQKEEESCIGSF